MLTLLNQLILHVIAHITDEFVGKFFSGGTLDEILSSNKGHYIAVQLIIADDLEKVEAEAFSRKTVDR